MYLSFNRLLLSALPMALFGCSMADYPAPSASATPPASEAQDISPAPMAAEDVEPENAEIGIREDYLIYVYDWPETLKDYPALMAYFRGESQVELGELRGFQSDDLRFTDAAAEFLPQYSSHMVWQVEGVSGALVSLSGDFYNYTGGAHGIYGTNSLLYDRYADKVMQAIDIFADKAAARGAIQPAYCALLDQERSRRRGPDYPRYDDMFWDCIDPLEQTLIFHAGIEGEKFDRLTIYAGPYAAGPYAEGDFTIELPVSARLKAAIRADYRDYFAVNGDAPIVAELE